MITQIIIELLQALIARLHQNISSFPHLRHHDLNYTYSYQLYIINFT